MGGESRVRVQVCMGQPERQIRWGSLASCIDRLLRVPYSTWAVGRCTQATPKTSPRLTQATTIRIPLGSIGGWGAGVERVRVVTLKNHRSRSTTPPFGLPKQMTVDTYAVCPCGSGKKIKFCKCKDSVGELDRILKMVEGGQVVPALDRLSKILVEHPDAAWALAIRGRLLLDLREYDSLSENAERFIRLQPSNPLALTQRAAALLFRGKVDEANDSLLEALTESGRDVDAFVLDVGSVLAFSLAQGGEFLTARVYATLAMMAQGYEGGQTAMQVLRQLNSAPTISQLLKAIPKAIARPSDAEWGERYDEAAGLLRSNKVMLAQSKFESLRRTVSSEPAILTGLLTCAIWRGDEQGQSDLLLKLSGCESLSFDERSRYLAMSALTQPEMPQLSIKILQLNADIDQADTVEMAFTADSRFVPLPADMLAGMRTSEDDIPPRAGFQVLDRDKPDTDGLPPANQVPEAIGMVFVYGRQTDRAARVEVQDVRERDLNEVRTRVSSALGESVTITQSDGEPMPLLVAVQPAIAMVRFQAKPTEAEKLQSEITRDRMPRAIATLPLGILGGATLADSAADDSKLLQRTALVRIIEHYDVIASRGEEILNDLRQLAGIEAQPTLKLTEHDVETVENEDLNRVDPSDLDGEALIYLLQRAQQISATPAIRKLASHLIVSDLPEEQRPAKLLAYMSLVNVATDAEDAIANLESAKAFAEQNNYSTANLLLSEVSLRLSIGDGEGFQAAIQQLTTRHSKDPETMARLQQLLMQYGLIRPDGSPRSAPGGSALAGAPAPSASSSGLWTPDGPTGPPSGNKSDGGGSKLWVPGMD